MKNKKSAVDKFREDMQELFARSYSRQLSDSIKRGIQAKKLRHPNPKNFYQFITKRELENDILLYPFMSSSMEEVVGKSLDTKYLYRIYIALTCFEDIQEKIREIQEQAIKCVLDDTDPIWTDIDAKYKGRKNAGLVNQSKV